MFPDPKKIQGELVRRNQLKVEDDDSFYLSSLIQFALLQKHPR